MWKIALHIALVFCVGLLTCDDTLVVKSAGRLPNCDFSGLDGDWTLTVEIKTTAEFGTIVAKSKLIDGFSCGLWENGGNAGQGKMLFLRQGKLIFDIGWKWFISSSSKINDNQWHTVGVRYERGLYILQVDQEDVSSRKSPGIPDHPQHITSFGYNIGHQQCNGDMAKAFMESIKNIFYNKENVATSQGLLKTLDFSGQKGDWELTASIRTTEPSGTIVAKSLLSTKNRPCGLWKKGSQGQGKMLFIRSGKLCFDIGWVGVVCGQVKINDNKWHTVGVKYSNKKYVLITDSNTSAASWSLPNGVSDEPTHVTSYGYSIGHVPCSGDMAKAFKGIIKNIEYRKL